MHIGRSRNSRQFDISYIAGWDWINYWVRTRSLDCSCTPVVESLTRIDRTQPNFLEGMNYTQHAWKQTACVNPDRKFGIDGVIPVTVQTVFESVDS